MSEPRAYTADEARKIFIDHLKVLAVYWGNLPNKTPLERTEGMLHSVLVTLDGGAGFLPAYDVIPSPHSEDKEFHISRGENYYVPIVINDCQLHELLYNN